MPLRSGSKGPTLADTPYKMVKLDRERIEEAIYPVGFYRKKAATIQEASSYIIEEFDGEVPRTEEELLKIRGVGPKAAHIILESAFGEKTVCTEF